MVPAFSMNIIIKSLSSSFFNQKKMKGKYHLSLNSIHQYCCGHFATRKTAYYIRQHLQ